MFDERANGFEYLEQGQVSDELMRKSHRYMHVVNNLLGGTAVVKKFVEAESARLVYEKTLNVLDIGAGSSDIPVSVLKWARRKGIDVRFTAVDRNHEALMMAERYIVSHGISGIELVEADIWDYKPAQQFDCAVGSMFFHHLSDQQILDLINRLRGFVGMSVLINDLRRSGAAYAGCYLLRPLLPWEAWHDATISIKRGFRPAELRTLLHQLPDAQVHAERNWLGRCSAVVRFDNSGDILE